MKCKFKCITIISLFMACIGASANDKHVEFSPNQTVIKSNIKSDSSLITEKQRMVDFKIIRFDSEQTIDLISLKKELETKSNIISKTLTSNAIAFKTNASLDKRDLSFISNAIKKHLKEPVVSTLEIKSQLGEPATGVFSGVQYKDASSNKNVVNTGDGIELKLVKRAGANLLSLTISNTEITKFKKFEVEGNVLVTPETTSNSSSQSFLLNSDESLLISSTLGTLLIHPVVEK